MVYNPTGSTSSRFLYKTDQISWNRCIDYYIQLPYQGKEGRTGNISKTWDPTNSCFQTKIWGVAGVGGRDAYRTEFPHMALLGYGSRNASVHWLCGGTVLSERFILTAGHCIASASAGPVTYAALGILKRSDPQDLWQIYIIQSIVRHPMYQPPSKYHDIALLKTMQRIIFNKNVMPACLPNLAVDADEETATATGWGTVGPHSQPADTLQVVKLQKFNSWMCFTLYGVHRLLKRGFDDETQMCYGDQRQVRDTCTGDSGGPLQIPGQLDYFQAVVVGVTSCGLSCGYAGHGSMYTRVRFYVPWIESVVWQ